MLDTFHKLNDLLSARERRNASILFVLMFIGAVLEVGGVGSIPLFVAAVSKPERLYELPVLSALLRWVGTPTHAQLIVGLGAGLVALFVIKNVYLGLLTYWQGRFAANRQSAISTRLFLAYLYSPYTFHLQRNSAELLRNTDHEAMVIATAIFQVLSLSLEFCLLALLLAVLLAIEPALTLFTGVLFGSVTWAFHRFTRRRLHSMAKHEQEHHLATIRAVNQGIGGIKDLKVLAREPFFARQFQVSAAERAHAGAFRSLFTSLPRLFLETLAVCGMFGATTILYLQGRAPDRIIASLALLAVALVRLMPSFQRISLGLASLRWGEMSLGVVHRDLMLLERKAEPAPLRPEKPLTKQWRKVAFERVSYRYPGSATRALNEVCLEVPRGSLIGLVGASGSGKSTLVDVLLGLLSPEEGRIAVDGEDIEQSLAAWRRQIGYIPQHIFLTDDSIRNNIAFAVDPSEVDEEAVRRAIVDAQLDDFVRTLPEGLDTVVGERGVRLSGGQRQRIGIARALYHDPTVLVMDEATSALDAQTERFIVDALNALRGTHTLVVIAHRMTTVRRCDTLYVMKEGRVVAHGTYEDLTANSPEFRAISM